MICEAVPEATPCTQQSATNCTCTGAPWAQQDHLGQIVEVRGPDGQPPYLVRHPDGHESLVFPGPDAVVEPAS